MFEYAYYAYITHILTFWSFSTLFFYLDYKTEKTNYLKKYKIRTKPINWNFYKSTIKDVMKTHIFITLPFNIVISPLWEYYGCTWESIHYSIFDVIIILLTEEIIFFYLHYLFHKQRYLYKKIHYKHHKWIDPVAVSALYAHPIEVIFCNYMPLIIGFFITHFNFYYALSFIAIGTINALYVHSGYSITCSKKVGHYQHHLIYNKQYGVLGILDILHDTN